jgi:hypothetical protein
MTAFDILDCMWATNRRVDLLLVHIRRRRVRRGRRDLTDAPISVVRAPLTYQYHGKSLGRRNAKEYPITSWTTPESTPKSTGRSFAYRLPVMVMMDGVAAEVTSLGHSSSEEGRLCRHYV